MFINYFSLWPIHICTISLYISIVFGFCFCVLCRTSKYRIWIWLFFEYTVIFFYFLYFFFVQVLELRTLCLPCRCFCCWTKPRPHFDTEIWQFTTVNISVRLLYLCSIFSLSLLHSLMIAEVNFFFNFISTHSLFWGVLFNFTVSA